MFPNNTTFVKHCQKRLGNSLITGVPKIISTKNSQRKAFKLIAFFFSIVGFLYQTYTFLKIYLDYPVVLHASIEEPEAFKAPAITLCNLNRLKRQSFCDLNDDQCAAFYWISRKSMCNIMKRFCPADRPENYSVLVPLPRDKDANIQTNEFLQAVGPQSQSDLLEKCTIEINGQSKKCNDSMMIQVSDNGLPYKCFTFFSLIGEPNKYPENLSLSDSYSFRLNLHPEEYMTIEELVGAYISVHDPRRLENPVAENVILEAGLSYRLYVTMEHRQYLPPPYETDCEDYVASWKKNGGQGPLTKNDCMQTCMMDAMMDQHGCLNEAIFYPNNFTLCPRNGTDYVSEELQAECESSCKEGCEVTEYSITTEVTGDITYKLCKEKDVHCAASYVDFEINFNRLRVEKLQSEPMFTNEELFSHIGGYMGLWLGISFITLFDLVEMLLDIIAYPVMKWREMKTKIVSYPDCKRNL